MKTKIRFGHNLYPKLERDGEFEKLVNISKGYHVEVEILYEEGCLEFEYDDEEYLIRRFPGDLSFYSIAEDQVLFYVNENFGMVDFYSYFPVEELLLSMETDYDNRLFDGLEEKILREIEELAERGKEEESDEV